MTEKVSITLGNPPSDGDGSENITVTGGKAISGWEGVEITLRCDGFPNSFSLSTSATVGQDGDAMPGNPGDLCWVTIGDDRVVTGYLDERDEQFGGREHSLRLSGRGKTLDLVDCSAEWPSAQLLDGDALSIAEKIVEPYNIRVDMGDGATAGPKVPQWALGYTDTGAAIIQRLAQNAGLLAYENADGELLLANVGTKVSASGVKAGPGGNVESGSVSFSMHQRYSEIVCCWYGTASLGDVSGSDFFYTEKDPNVRRHRRLNIILEQVGGVELSEEFTKRRARWEATRRMGQSLVVEVTVDSWRDKDGGLWMPNTLVPVEVPGNTISPLLIASVRFRRDKSGTRADLVLMPKEAFAIEPIALQKAAVADVKGADEK